MELFNALGLSWPTLISQLINFGILYWLLAKFALKPLLANIEARQQQISEGLANSQAADQALAQAEAQKDEIVTAARAQARDIIASARQSASQQEEQIVGAAKAQAAQIIEDARAKNDEDRQKMLSDVRGQIAEIVSIGVKNVIGEVVPVETVNRHLLESGVKA